MIVHADTTHFCNKNDVPLYNQNVALQETLHEEE